NADASVPGTAAADARRPSLRGVARAGRARTGAPRRTGCHRVPWHVVRPERAPANGANASVVLGERPVPAIPGDARPTARAPSCQHGAADAVEGRICLLILP